MKTPSKNIRRATSLEYQGIQAGTLSAEELLMHCIGALPRWFDEHLFRTVLEPVLGTKPLDDFVERLPFRRFCRRNGNLGWAYDRPTRRAVYELFLGNNRRQEITEVLHAYALGLDQRAEGLDFANDPLVAAGYFDIKGVYEIEATHVRLMLEDDQLSSVERILQKFYLRNREISKNASLNRRTVKSLEDLLRLGAIRSPDVITLLQMMRVMTDPWIDEDPQRGVVLKTAADNSRLSALAHTLANMEIGTDIGLQLGTKEAKTAGKFFDAAETLAVEVGDEYLIGRISQKRARRLLSTPCSRDVPTVIDHARKHFELHHRNSNEDISLSIIECDRLLCTYLKNERSDKNGNLATAETIARKNVKKLTAIGAPYQQALHQQLLSTIILLDQSRDPKTTRREARALTVSALKVFDTSSFGRDYAQSLITLTGMDISNHETASAGDLMDEARAAELKLRILECDQIFTEKRSVNGLNSYHYTLALIDLLSGQFSRARAQFHDLVNDFKQVTDGFGVRSAMLRLLELELRTGSDKTVIATLFKEIYKLHKKSHTLTGMETRLQAMRVHDKKKYLSL